MIDFTFRGEEYHLYFNGSALFNAYAKFGADKNILDMIEPMNKAGFEATVWLLCELATQGELYRRFLGYTPRPRLDYAKTLVQIQPKELPEIKAAVIAAMNEGFAREADEGYDPWLAELESQKKKQNVTKAEYIRLLTQGLGLSVREGMMLPPGLILDILELGKKKEEDDGNTVDFCDDSP